eukprot:1161341-Pelagomonas_calceolata.AAC.7
MALQGGALLKGLAAGKVEHSCQDKVDMLSVKQLHAREVQGVMGMPIIVASGSLTPGCSWAAA